MSDDDDWSDFDSGPFCRHWVSPPGDCEDTCADCGHRCAAHDEDGCDECDCKAWREQNEKAEHP